MIANLTENL